MIEYQKPLLVKIERTPENFPRIFNTLRSYFNRKINLSIDLNLPHSTLDLYRQIAKIPPYHIPQPISEDIYQACHSGNESLSREGFQILMILHMKSILSAIKPFTSQDNEWNDNLLVYCLESLQEVIKKTKTNVPLSQFIHLTVRESAMSFTAEQLRIPIKWVTTPNKEKRNVPIKIEEPVHFRIARFRDKLLERYPLGLSQNNLNHYANRMMKLFGVDYKDALDFLKEENRLLSPTNASQFPKSEEVDYKPLYQLLSLLYPDPNNREYQIIVYYLGLSDQRINEKMFDGRKHSADETSALFDITEQQVRLIIAGFYRKVRNKINRSSESYP